MTRRRRVRRFCLEGLSPEECICLLQDTRAQRADTPARRAALHHPARWPGRRVPFHV